MELDFAGRDSPPLRSPPSPPSPPRMNLIAPLFAPVLFFRPVRPLLPELNPGYVDYLLPDSLVEPTEYHSDLTLQEVKALILNPKLRLKESRALMMYANSEFRPTHLPHISDATHLPQIMRVFLEWFMLKEVEVESDDKNLMQNFGPWIDPTPLLPLIRTVALVRSS